MQFHHSSLMWTYCFDYAFLLDPTGGVRHLIKPFNLEFVEALALTSSREYPIGKRKTGMACASGLGVFLLLVFFIVKPCSPLSPLTFEHDSCFFLSPRHDVFSIFFVTINKIHHHVFPLYVP